MTEKNNKAALARPRITFSSMRQNSLTTNKYEITRHRKSVKKLNIGNGIAELERNSIKCMIIKIMPAQDATLFKDLGSKNF